MALSFIGKPIALISHSDVRYRGILAGIDPAASTIQLSKVYSMGTEDRRPPQEYIPAVPDPYEFIIFRASEVKDLSVDQPVEPPRGRSVHDDPAVLGASSQLPHQQQQQQPQTQLQQQQQPPLQTVLQTQQAQFAQQPQQQPGGGGNGNNGTSSAAAAAARAHRLHSATASLETVERALGDLRVAQSNGHTGNPPDVAEEATMHLSNKPNNEEDGSVEDNGEDTKTSPAYDPSTSFFDSLTPAQGGGGGGPTGPRGGPDGAQQARVRREEERVKNVATFGEAGRVSHGGLRSGGFGGVGMGGPGGRDMRGGRGGRGGRGSGYRGGPSGGGRGRGGRPPNAPGSAVGPAAGVRA
ncbi:hypothetical protein D9757_014566 [Collybiopsis confluens]|uniref:Uncharacterized protein n=1 Tax=Collybiopsis confluens TaxID=2823264 RepID=A0A8H5FLW0_9AGAR|nr:hypothetical protein D9757_014566 [Collybiopsis confluens]